MRPVEYEVDSPAACTIVRFEACGASVVLADPEARVAIGGRARQLAGRVEAIDLLLAAVRHDRAFGAHVPDRCDRLAHRAPRECGHRNLLAIDRGPGSEEIHPRALGCRDEVDQFGARLDAVWK